MSDIDLKPCPFCGGDAEIVHINDGENEGGSCVSCSRCLASSNVEFEFKENFVSNWNRRTEVDLITSLRAELERKDAALRTVGEGDVPRPIGTYYREDKTPSKNDQCIHGLWMYEECGQCIEAFCRAALSAQKEE